MAAHAQFKSEPLQTTLATLQLDSPNLQLHQNSKKRPVKNGAGGNDTLRQQIKWPVTSNNDVILIILTSKLGVTRRSTLCLEVSLPPAPFLTSHKFLLAELQGLLVVMGIRQ
jgi:hypothetical protein